MTGDIESVPDGYAEKFLDVLLAYLPKRDKLETEEAQTIMRVLWSVAKVSCNPVMIVGGGRPCTPQTSPNPDGSNPF